MMQLTSLMDDLGVFDTVLLDRQKLNEQIAEKIQLQITDGKLKPGDRLPPERELASLLKVNRATVREAIHLLRERGLVERKNGRGTRIVAMLPPVHRCPGSSSSLPSGFVTILLKIGR